MGIIDNFEAMLAKGQDNALLRFSLGNAHLKAGNPQAALTHLRVAVEMDAHYSAAWKSLAKALSQIGELAEAVGVYEQGIQVAEAKGDMQAVKEMRVYKKRLEKTLAAGE
jgi:Tfp pilus assembly protein PilF